MKTILKMYNSQKQATEAFRKDLNKFTYINVVERASEHNLEIILERPANKDAVDIEPIRLIYRTPRNELNGLRFVQVYTDECTTLFPEEEAKLMTQLVKE